MKRIALLAALAALPFAPALTYAQADKPAPAAPAGKAATAPAPKPAAAPAAKPAETPIAPATPVAAPAPVSKPVQQAAAKPASGKGGRSRATRDARRCLQLASNTAIIKCAEKYR